MKRRSDSGTGKGYAFAKAALNSDRDGCLLWPYGTAEGYGHFRLHCATVAAHVFVCTEKHGHAPTPQHEVAHSCGNRACIAWKHLRWDTRAGNHADKLRHGTHARGERNIKANLTSADVLAICQSQETQQALAAKYGVCRSNISHIRRGRNWAWL